MSLSLITNTYKIIKAFLHIELLKNIYGIFREYIQKSSTLFLIN